MKFKKLLALLLACIMLLSIAACGGGEGEGGGDGTTTTPKATGDGPAVDPEDPDNDDDDDDNRLPAVDRDLGGRDITIGIFWNPSEIAPGTDYGERRQEYLEDIQETYNFTIKYEKVAEWGDMADIAGNSIIADNPVADLFTADSKDVINLFKRNYFYPVSDLPSAANLGKDPKWNKLIHDFITFNGVTYGFYAGYEPRNGLFFNKDVLSSAGIDPDSIYEHQRNNTWTWEVFEEMCKKVTQDIDNDGITDIHGINSFNADFLTTAVISNGASLFTRDADGVFHNTSQTNEFFEACEFVHNLMLNGYVFLRPDGAEWDYFKAGFNDGKSAFRVAEEYAKDEIGVNVSFDWGFAYFPRGPRASELSTVYRENVRYIPNNASMTAEIADDIFFAYDLFTNPVPGFEEDTGAWKYEAYPKYKDNESVDETLARMRTGEGGILNYPAYIPGSLGIREIADNIWFDEKTPAQLIEEAQRIYDVTVEEFNDEIAKLLSGE